jgi:poly(A) polymerase/tRNA nucleotidyltransferase (CCA-adding enzyme)
VQSIEQLKKYIPSYIYQISDVLISNGYKAFLVGGAVRNMLLNVEPKDFDIATDALPEQIESLFTRSINVNAKFGTILVISEDENGERFDVEVTTFRKEENYFGGRWPANVEFTNDLYVDLSRRDFTVNALAIDMRLMNEVSANGEEIIIDYFSGKEDLDNKIIRAVGNHIERFTEDGLRGYRACRLASVYGFSIEDETFKAIQDTLHVAKMVSLERVRDELLKLIYNSAKPSVGLELMRRTGLLELFMPELLLTIGITQPMFHTDDLYTHSLKCMDIAEDSVKIAALLHDIGKVQTRTEDDRGIHFYGHDVEGAKICEAILTRLKFPKVEIKRIVNLVRWHMFFYPSAQWRKDNVEQNDLTDNDGGWTDGAVRRFIRKVGEEALEDLFRLRIADATSNPKSNFDTAEIEVFAQRISAVRAKDMVIKIADLDLNGGDLNAVGIPSGPIMGEILNVLLEMVIDDPGMNKKELLLASARDYYQKKISN